MDIKTKAYVFITLAMVGGALFPLALKVATDNGANIFTFMFFSYIIATATSFTLVVLKGKLPELRTYLRRPKEYVKTGLAGFAFAGLIFYGLIYAEQFIAATFATVIYRMQPLLMLAFIPFLLREKISRTQIAALLLGVGGIYIALSGGNLLAFSGASTVMVLFLLLIVFIGAFAAIFIKRYATNMECTMFMFNSVSLVFATALFFFSGAHLMAFNTLSFLALLYIGIPTSVFVTYFYFRAFRTLKTTFVTNFYLLSPFITAVFAAAFLSETIEPYYLAIAVLVSIGIFIQRFDKKGGTYATKSGNKLRDFVIFDVSGAFSNTGEVGIANVLRNGGRVLAVKLSAKHENAVMDMIKEKSYSNVYTHRHAPIAEEVNFVKETTGAGPDDMILLKAGGFDDGEAFFSDVSDAVGPEALEKLDYHNNNK